MRARTATASNLRCRDSIVLAAYSSAGKEIRSRFRFHGPRFGLHFPPSLPPHSPSPSPDRRRIPKIYQIIRLDRFRTRPSYDYVFFRRRMFVGEDLLDRQEGEGKGGGGRNAISARFIARVDFKAGNRIPVGRGNANVGRVAFDLFGTRVSPADFITRSFVRSARSRTHRQSR